MITPEPKVQEPPKPVEKLAKDVSMFDLPAPPTPPPKEEEKKEVEMFVPLQTQVVAELPKKA